MICALLYNAYLYMGKPWVNRIISISEPSNPVQISVSLNVFEEAYCTLCKKAFSVASGGIYRIIQHKQGGKHASLQASLQQQSRLHCDLGTMSVDSSRVIVLSQKEQISRAEILQLLRLIKHDQSFSSCDDLVSVLCASFNELMSDVHFL